MSKVKLNARRENGHIIISEDSFEHLLNCLANQKFVGEAPPCGDAMARDPDDYVAYAAAQQVMQEVIDDFYHQCRELVGAKNNGSERHEGPNQPLLDQAARALEKCEKGARAVLIPALEVLYRHERLFAGLEP